MSQIKVVQNSVGLLPFAKKYARTHEVDLAIPNCQGSGVGNVLVYTRLIEEMARHLGRPISIITAPLSPKVGTVDGESEYPFYENNPFIERIINAYNVDPEGFSEVNREEDDLIQVNHIIENLCFAYGLQPRCLRPSLFLTKDEQSWALLALKHLPRPLVCLHPGGTTSSLPGCPWHRINWLHIIETLKMEAGFFQVGRKNSVDQDLGLPNPGKTIREAMALIWASDVFIGYDSSPMHMATALQKPVITIIHMQNKYNWETSIKETFTPSVILRWLYPFNTNFAIMPEDINGRVLLYRVIDAVRGELKRLAYKI